jgi:hypothetical protein
VRTPKIGSRVGQKCFGGILGFHAVLRRDFEWGNLNWEFFGVLLVSPRGACEEGGPFMCRFMFLGEFIWGVTPMCVKVGLSPNRRGVY